MSAVPGPPGQPSQPGQGQQPSAVTPASPGVPPGVPAPYQHKTPWTAYIKPVIWTLVAIYAVGFVFLNTTTISINFVFVRAEVALIFVLVALERISRRGARFHGMARAQRPVERHPLSGPAAALAFAACAAPVLMGFVLPVGVMLALSVQAPGQWLAPGLLAVLVFTLMPLVSSVYIAFTNYSTRYLRNFRFVGLENFRRILVGVDRGNFVRVLTWTLTWAVLTTVLNLALGLVLALLLNNPRLRERGLYRTILIYPWALPVSYTHLTLPTIYSV